MELDSFFIFPGRHAQEKYRTIIKAEAKITIPMIESIVIITSCCSPGSKYICFSNAADFGDDVGADDPGVTVISCVVSLAVCGATVSHAANNKLI